MLQYFDTLADTSGNALVGATLQVLNWPALTNATIYSTNGTASPIANNTAIADVTGQVSFYVEDGAYQLVYSFNSTVYKTRAPVQMLDPMGFVAATDTGAANAYVVTDSRYPAQLYVGMKFEFLAIHANTLASTLNLNSTGAQPINQTGGVALAPGMIQAGGLVRLEWDGTEFQLISSQSQPYYPITADEIAAGVTPVNYTYQPGYFLRYGAKIDGSTDDTTAFNTWRSLAGYATSVHGPESDMNAGCGISVVSEVAFTQAGINFNGNGMIFRGNAVSPLTSIVDVKTGNGVVIEDLSIDANFNTEYQCNLHWYTNYLPSFYPGFCRFDRVTVSAGLLGLCIGGLPSQSLPLPAQNAGPEGAGIATDAPLSESYIQGLNTSGCVIGLYMAQPNGKITLVAPQLIGTGSNATYGGKWAGHSYGSSGYTDASACALNMKLGATQSSELTVLGGSLEQTTEPTGLLANIINCHAHFIGTTVESIAPTYIGGISNVTFDHCLDMGWNFPASNYSPFLIDPLASGILSFTDCKISLPSANLTSTLGAPFVKGASSTAGTYATNTKGFSVNFHGTELADVSAAPLNGSGAYVPTVIGVQAHFKDCKYTSYNGTPAITAQYEVDDGEDLLAGVVDQSAYTITPYGANVGDTSGGWVFTETGGSSWGSAPSGITILGRVIDTCIKLTGVTSSTATATSPKFNVSPQKAYLFRGWMQGGATGAQIDITVNWFQFGSAGPSGTPTTNLLVAADTVIGATPIPFLFLCVPPKDATQAQIVLSAENGATMMITDPSWR